MADLSQIFAQSLFSDPGVGADAELNAFKNTLNQNNYWNMAAAPVLGAKFNTSTWSPATTLGVTAGQSFIGSLLQGLGAQSNARQVEAISSVLPQLQADPVNTPLPEGVDAEAGAALRSSLIRDMFKRDQQVAQALATKGIKVGADGSWATVPGARDALNALDGISPALQAVEVKVRSGTPLTEADNAILAAAPNDAKRILGQIEYQRAIESRNADINERQEKGFEFRRTFDPTINRELFNKQSAVDGFLTQKEGIAEALDKFDPNEGIAGAIGRGVAAGWVKDSEAADLKRQIDQVIFAMLKPTFPGQISDQERQVLQAAAGGDMGVPIGTLKRIFDRQENYLLKNVNKDLNRALDAGYQVPFKPMGSVNLEPQTRVKDGITYRKVQGGWAPIE